MRVGTIIVPNWVNHDTGETVLCAEIVRDAWKRAGYRLIHVASKRIQSDGRPGCPHTLITEASMRDTNTTMPSVPATSDVIKVPGGTLSRGRQTTLTASPPGLTLLAGSRWPEFNQVLLEATMATLPNQDPDAASLHIAAASAALAAFKPVDEIEGMIAAQAVGLHFAAMECLRRAMLPGQTSEVASKLRKDGANMARAMTDMLDAMDRKRGKGPQVVRVERVVVHEGGQAIVGNVKGGDTPAVTAVPKPAAPQALGQDMSGITLDDRVGKQPKPVEREGV